MSATNSTVEVLLGKIRRLPPDKIAEVGNFVDFLDIRNQEHAVVRAATMASEPSFAKVWDNPDDSSGVQVGPPCGSHFGPHSRPYFCCSIRSSASTRIRSVSAKRATISSLMSRTFFSGLRDGSFSIAARAVR